MYLSRTLPIIKPSVNRFYDQSRRPKPALAAQALQVPQKPSLAHATICVNLTPPYRLRTELQTAMAMGKPARLAQPA
jgi:hypothetical protein